MNDEQRDDRSAPGSAVSEIIDTMARVIIPMMLFFLFLMTACDGMRTGARCFGLLFVCSIVFQLLEARATRRHEREPCELETPPPSEPQPLEREEKAVAGDPTSEAQVFVSDPDGTISMIP